MKKNEKNERKNVDYTTAKNLQLTSHRMAQQGSNVNSVKLQYHNTQI